MLDVKNIYKQNARMDAIAKQLGTNSALYQKESLKIKEALPPEFVREVNGVTHIFNTTGMKESGITNLSVPEVRTWKNIKEAHKEGLKDYTAYINRNIKDKKKWKKVSMREYLEFTTFNDDELTLLYGESDKAKEALSILEVRDRKKTYNEIAEVKELING